MRPVDVADEAAQDQYGFALYVHWPFCASKCPYCDFNSHIGVNVDHSEWRQALLSELEKQAELVGQRRLQSIFFGGGTPSLMEPATVASLIDATARLFLIDERLEITLEANPSSVEAEKFAEFRLGGVNRISIGVQSLRNDDLRALGRLHSAREARDALEIAKNLFSRTSFDLIYARQHQTTKDWEVELREALNFLPDHLSLYQLTIEAGTVFSERHERGLLKGLPNDDMASDFFQITQEVTRAAGLFAYEISNHAKSGRECRHNLTYWRYGDYIGIGPGAHGRLTIGKDRFATEAPKSPSDWIKATRSAGGATKLVERLTNEAQLCELLLMGLRLDEGVLMDRISAFENNAVSEKIQMACKEGYCFEDAGHLRVHNDSKILLNQILKYILG